MTARAYAGVLGFVLLLAAAPPVLADTVWRKNGSKIVGKIVAEEPTRIQILFRAGTQEAKVWIARSDIALIEHGKTPEEEYEERLAALDPADIDGHKSLIAWATTQQLVTQVQALTARLPGIELLARKAKHPTRWCRTCDAVGEVSCADCGGSGEVRKPCERCDSTGKISCQVCGHRDGGGFLRCKRCSGAGEYERFDPAKGRKVKTKCQDCAGKGTHKCPECDGKQSQACDVCQGKKGAPEVCPTCKGTPKSPCTVCRGTGLQPVALTPEELAREQANAAAPGTGGAAPGAVPRPESRPAETPTTRPGT
ncbi:MAG: hypothetical protein AB7O52_02530 [Planctomycetota bacterium]